MHSAISTLKYVGSAGSDVKRKERRNGALFGLIIALYGLDHCGGRTNLARLLLTCYRGTVAAVA